jgi:hypothetical protein
VTEAGIESIELRVLVTAIDSGRSWDLRCHVREGLVSYLQREFPQYLPTRRTRMDEVRGPARDAQDAAGAV